MQTEAVDGFVVIVLGLPWMEICNLQSKDHALAQACAAGAAALHIITLVHTRFSYARIPHDMGELPPVFTVKTACTSWQSASQA